MNIVSWSGGKDSTATLILAKEKGIKIDKAFISLPFFDYERKIYADRPEHIEWLFNFAIPLIKSWGTDVEVLSSHHDYVHSFYRVVGEKAKEERRGKYQGFLISGLCRMNEYKTEPLKKRKADFPDSVEFVGIGADETERLERMNNRKQRSLLAEYGLTTKDAYALCEKNGLLSPNYTIIPNVNIRGCWFCPNANIKQFADLKVRHPDLYHELEVFNESIQKCASQKFNHSFTFSQLDEMINNVIWWKENQITMEI